MSPPILIRDSSPADLTEIQAIYAHHVLTGTASFELDPPSVQEIADRRDNVLHNGFPYLIATRDAKVVGYAYANFFRTRPAYRFTVENSIYLAAEQMGQGIGKRLLAELIARCEAVGCRQMIAVIGDSANTASIGLHASMGFRFAGVLRSSGWKFNRWLDTVSMQRDLGAGDSGPAA